MIQKLVIRELEQDRRVLVIVNRVQHGKTLWKMIPEAELVTGSVRGEIRNKVLKALRTKGCVIGTVFDEGSDIPELDTVVLASAGKSQRQLLQRIGRVLRPAEGKRAKVIDFVDNDSPKNDSTYRKGILYRQAFQRIQVYRAQGYVMKVFRTEVEKPRSSPVSLLRRGKR